ncbi:rod-binding protein [Mangrovicella endophytica]|uniref:rod-binding protein n=1 Tax=Mangrovicella endophytica TaxID=2066697 RepID=UPI000C9DD544|nr:rod-binding protein [Mangrovicella endophytica]
MDVSLSTSLAPDRRRVAGPDISQRTGSVGRAVEAKEAGVGSAAFTRVLDEQAVASAEGVTGTQDVTEGAPAAAASSSQPLQIVKHQTGQRSPYEKFEGFVLRTFVESMLPSDKDGYFGTGTAGNIYRSMLAEQIGDQMAKDGGIGIAAMLQKAREGKVDGAAGSAGAHLGGSLKAATNDLQALQGLAGLQDKGRS